MANTEIAVLDETGPDGHVYNSDLLISPGDLKNARQEFSYAYPVVDFPELRSQFVPLNLAANRAKRESRAWGFWAVLMALIAFMAGSGEILWRGLPTPFLQIVAFVSAILGFGSFVIAGTGILFGKRKREWLRSRMQTELLRQFHFQTFVCRFQDVVRIVAALRRKDKDAKEYEEERSKWFEDYRKLIGGSGAYDKTADSAIDTVFLKIIKPALNKPLLLWLHNDGKEPRIQATDLDQLAATEVFKIYRRLRFEQQIGYATYQLRHKNDPPKITVKNEATPPAASRLWFPGQTQPLRRWDSFLKTLWWTSILVVVALHIYVIYQSIYGDFEHVSEDAISLHSYVHVAIIWSALIAIASRTLAEGNQLHREIQRYKEYLVVCTEYQRQFDHAESVEEKFGAMARMERAAFDEMRVFLRDQEDATYVF